MHTAAAQPSAHPFAWTIIAALAVATLPFAVVLYSIRHATDGAFWWIILAASVFVVVFPLGLSALALRASRRHGDLPRL